MDPRAAGDRRTVLKAVLAALGALPLAALGQRDGRPLKLALLLPADVHFEKAFREQLAKLGYVEGRNLVVDRRSADSDFSRLPALAAELLRGQPDILAAFVTQASIAASKATSSVPVVFVAVSDPVASGLVTNLARPGGNVTGTAALQAVVVGKQFELLREIVPGASRVVTLWNSSNAVFQAQALGGARAAAESLRMRLIVAEVRKVADIEPALARAASERPDAAVVLPDPLLVTNARHIAELFAARRLPAVGSGRNYAEAGLLASYGPDLAEAARRAADVVHRIAQGKPPGEIPIEVIGKFERVVNLRTAAALGITVPPAVLARADDVVR
ncbi:MAG: ABC transporter substrate-binding protein [Betaproteobacteria bacterium]|nr:ABC transporter substrate-binding protein [Betaproteobacteria bacterium]